MTKLIAIYLSSDRLQTLRRAVDNLSDQSELPAALLPYLRGEYHITLILTAQYSAKDYFPSTLYDDLIPDLIAWVSFFFSHPALVLRSNTCIVSTRLVGSASASEPPRLS